MGTFTDLATDVLVTLVNDGILLLPLLGYYFVGEGFELTVLLYLAIIAYCVDPMTTINQ